MLKNKIIKLLYIMIIIDVIMHIHLRRLWKKLRIFYNLTKYKSKNMLRNCLIK